MEPEIFYQYSQPVPDITRDPVSQSEAHMVGWNLACRGRLETTPEARAPSSGRGSARWRMLVLLPQSMRD